MSSGNWSFDNSDSILEIGSYEFYVKELKNDTIYLLDSQNKKKYLIKYKTPHD
jgi:hypothetical protein